VLRGHVRASEDWRANIHYWMEEESRGGSFCLCVFPCPPLGACFNLKALSMYMIMMCFTIIIYIRRRDRLMYYTETQRSLKLTTGGAPLVGGEANAGKWGTINQGNTPGNRRLPLDLVETKCHARLGILTSYRSLPAQLAHSKHKTTLFSCFFFSEG
jgi:hypothetical protein